MRNIIRILFFLILLQNAVFGQSPFFQSYTVLKRNEAIQINAIFQDKSGFMWYGTNRGLFRFDGVDQKQYTTNDSLPDNHVTAIGQDSTGRIWAGHRNGNLSYFDGGAIRKFNPQEGSSENEISDILFDRQGNLWFSTLNDGLYYFTNDRLFRVDENEGLPDVFVYDLAEDPVGNIWAGTDGGVGVCTLKDGKVKVKVLNYRQGLPDNIVKKIVVGSNNTVWMGTEDAGVIAYNSFSGKSTPLLKEGWKYGTLTDFIIRGNQVWMSSLETGLIVYDMKSGLSKIYTSKNTNTKIDFSSINTLAADFEQNVWIGSKTGITRTLGDHVEYVDNFDPFHDTNVLAVTSDIDNNLWYATGEGLFKRSRDKSGMIKLERPLLHTPYQKHTVISLYSDPNGNIWAGLYGEGALQIDPNGRVKNILKELRNGNILNISGKDDLVWLATLEGSTRITVDGSYLDIENFTHEEGMISDYIYQVFVDSKNRTWFATDGRGVGMLDENGFHAFEQGLKSKVVYGFAEDKHHTIWANVQEDGLYKFDGKTFQPLKSESRLRDRNISCLTSDQYGNLVAIHDMGIDLYDVDKNKMRYLGDEVGIGNKKPNLNALAKDSNGRIYIGTDNGIIDYADLSNGLSATPTPVVAGLRISGRPVNISRNLSFSHDQNNITIQFVGFWYQSPANVNYQYKLDNYDADWIKTRDRSTTYSSLPPGTYTFHVRASESEDFRDLPEARIRFTIQPPFWKTMWFYLLMVVILILSGSAYIKYREKRLLEDKRILEMKVTERTMEIQKQAEEIQAQNEEIQAQNEEIQSQAEEIQGINDNLEEIVRARTAELERKNKAAEESAFIIAHELRAPVASILGLINLISKVPMSDEAKAIIEHLDESGDKLNTVVRSITKAIERGDRKS